MSTPAGLSITTTSSLRTIVTLDVFKTGPRYTTMPSLRATVLAAAASLSAVANADYNIDPSSVPISNRSKRLQSGILAKYSNDTNHPLQRTGVRRRRAHAHSFANRRSPERPWSTRVILYASFFLHEQRLNVLTISSGDASVWLPLWQPAATECVRVLPELALLCLPRVGFAMSRSMRLQRLQVRLRPEPPLRCPEPAKGQHDLDSWADLDSF